MGKNNMKNSQLEELVVRCKKREIFPKECWINEYASQNQVYCLYRNRTGNCCLYEKKVARYMLK